MQRHFGILVVFGLAASALAGSATAQSRGADQVSSYLPSPPVAQSSFLDDRATPADSRVNLQDSYDHAITMLKKKMDRLTREDGGQLSAAHQASLQKELDDVNHRFRLANRF
jgi:hypothetical protein